MQQINVKEIAAEYAEHTVQALATAQRMGMVNGADDLQSLIAASIETALEDLLQRIDSLKTGKNEA